jgi:hypothetical protein
MSDPVWQFTADPNIVSRVWPSGQMDSCSISDSAYLAWVAAGNTATPYTAPARTWANVQADALAALNHSDTTMHRISEALALGLTMQTSADTVAYVQWRRSLRSIIGAATGDATTVLPAEPPYPTGT